VNKSLSLDHLINDYRGAFNTFRDVDVMEGERLTEMAMPFNLIKEGVHSGSELLIYSGVEIRYFLRFCKLISDSIITHSKCAYHFHVAVTDLDELALLEQEIEKNFTDSRIGISYHITGHRMDNAYYTMVRYFYALKIKNIYNRNVIICDVDAIFNRDPAGDVDEYKNVGLDVAIYGKYRLASLIPWFKYSCTYIYISNSTFGSDFLRRLALMSQHLFSKVGPITYNIDQNLVFSIDQYFSDKMEGYASAVVSIPLRSVRKNDFPLKVNGLASR
jgi:hypothetical protein